MTASINLFARDSDTSKPVTNFGPDFPFPFDDWIRHPAGLGQLPIHRHGQEVAVIGSGMAGMTAAYGLLKMGLKPVIYQAGRMGGACAARNSKGPPVLSRNWAACGSRNPPPPFTTM